MRTLLSLALLALALVGCSTGATYTPPGPISPMVTHLYVGNDNAAGTVPQFNLPLTAASTANFSIPNAANITTLALDTSGHMAAGDFSGHLAVLTTLPLSGSSTASASFNNGAATNNGQLAFTPGGTLYAADTTSHVYGYTPPFTNATVPSRTTTSAGLTGAVGLGFDTAGNMYVSNASGAGSNMLVYAPPYTGAPTVTTTVVAGSAYRKLGMTATQLFVADVGVSGIKVYTLPLTNASVPAFTIADAQDPEAISVDPSGNLYAGNLLNSTVTVYTPPYSAASAPSTTLTIAGFAIFGIAIGT